ncbi:MAG: SsrA-binding protein SmpB [Candidatus Omnitrophica bacterium]|nr:SsrA-binding protein SmpB [Candidatus Omnitrophota bacterium]MBU1853968.1 SsrA-binding protein SmpB [Candidatus Omnitrophota bacterium]
MKNNATITNRVARRDYFILETVEAGLELKGPEVKSLRAGRASLKEAFAKVERGEIFLHHMHISPYEYTTLKEQNPLRPKKLLLHKKEIIYLISKISQERLALVPLRVYFKKGFAKVELGLAKGKKQYDKREAVRRKEAQRVIDRVKKFQRG